MLSSQSPSGPSSSTQAHDVERLRLALNLEELQPGRAAAMESTPSPSKRPNPFSPPVRPSPARTPFFDVSPMPDFATYQPLTSNNQTSQASSALTALSSSSEVMDVEEEDVVKVKEEPRMGSRGPNPFSRSESPVKPPAAYASTSTAPQLFSSSSQQLHNASSSSSSSSHRGSQRGSEAVGSQRSVSVASNEDDNLALAHRPTRLWGLSPVVEELAVRSTSVEPRPLKRARSSSRQPKQEERSISPTSWNQCFGFLDALEEEDSAVVELFEEEQEEPEHEQQGSSTSSLSPPPPSPVPSAQESLLTPTSTLIPFQPSSYEVDRPAARTRSRTDDGDSPQKPSQHQDQDRRASPRLEMEEQQQQIEEEEEEDPMGLKRAEEMPMAQEEEDMECFVEIPERAHTMSPCQASSDLEEREASRTRSPESAHTSTDELLSSGAEDGRDDSPPAMEDEDCLPSSSQSQLKIEHLERQLALERKRNQSLADDVAVGLKENANVLRLAGEIREQAQTMSRGNRRKEAEMESLKREVSDLKGQLSVQKGRVKGLTTDVKTLAAENANLKTLTTSQSTSLLDFQLQLYTAQQALLDPNHPHAGPDVLPHPAFVHMVPTLASMPAKKKAQKENEFLKQQVFELTNKNWAMQARLEKLQEKEMEVEVAALEGRLLMKMPEKRETRERRELDAATIEIDQLKQRNLDLQTESANTKANLERLKSHAAELQRSSTQVAGLLASL